MTRAARTPLRKAPNNSATITSRRLHRTYEAQWPAWSSEGCVDLDLLMLACCRTIPRRSRVTMDEVDERIINGHEHSTLEANRCFAKRCSAG